MHGSRVAALLAASVIIVGACTGGSGTSSSPSASASVAPSASASEPVASASAPVETVDVRLQLQWFPQAQFAGYFAAVDQGFYAAEGLNVEIKPGAVEIVPATVVASGQAEFGISWVPRMLGPRESGADVQIIGQVFQRSGTLQVSWADSGITTPADWAGKKVGTWGFGNEHELFAALRKNGIDPENPDQVTIVPQQFDMNAFLAGDIDAAQAMIYNEYAQVLEKINPDTGQLYQPADLNVITMESTGTAMLQDAIFASEAWLAEEGNEDVARRFLKASFQGWIYCRDNVDSCVASVLDADAQLPKGHQTWQMNEINALIWPSPDGIGIMDQAAYDRTVAVATEGKILTQPVREPAFRNDLAEAALAELADADTTGTSYVKPEVVLTENGQ